MLPRIIQISSPISDVHKKVFETLLAANQKSGLNLTLRVAGGWVRDLILGLNSNDIDISVETPPGRDVVSGLVFAEAVSHYLTETYSQEKKIGIIRANPALSKHIETATLGIDGIPVEFCALRTDEYSSESRIPIVRPGTPLEDAQRRDFTINALFYNLNKNVIEDYTSGLEDIENRIIRCPLSPSETFKDDPLRLLRGIRFMGQLGNFGFNLDSSVKTAVSDEIINALQVKVSRERIGTELAKMLHSPFCGKCMELLQDLRVLQNILLVEIYVPSSKKKGEPLRATPLINTMSPEKFDAEKYWRSVIRCVVPLLASLENPFGISQNSVEVGVLFSLVLPFYRGLDNSKELEGRLTALIMNGLKLSQMHLQGIRVMIEGYSCLLKMGLNVAAFESSELSDHTKHVIFNALSHLNDTKKLEDPAEHRLKIVLCVYALLEWQYNDFSSDFSTPADALRSFQRLWTIVAQYPELLTSFSTDLRVKGNDIKDAGIPAKEISSVMLKLREQMALSPLSVDTYEKSMSWVCSQFLN